MAGRRELGNTSKSTQREQCRLEREREEDRIALYRSLILYIMPEKTKRARARAREHVPTHATVQARADATTVYTRVYTRIQREDREKLPTIHIAARARARVCVNVILLMTF